MLSRKQLFSIGVPLLAAPFSEEVLTFSMQRSHLTRKYPTARNSLISVTPILTGKHLEVEQYRPQNFSYFPFGTYISIA